MSAFPCVGKSFLYQKYPDKISDSDSSKFSWSSPGVRNVEFPRNYIKHIKGTPKQIVLVSSHKEVRDALVESGLNWIFVRPATVLRDVYVERARLRGSPVEFCDMLRRKWDEFMLDAHSEHRCSLALTLDKADLYLSDVAKYFMEEKDACT